MEQEEKKDAENPPDMSSKPELLETDDSKQDAESSEKNNSRKDAKSSEKDDSRKDADSSEKNDSMKDTESSEMDDGKKDGVSSEKDSAKKDAESSEKDSSMKDDESSENDNKMKDAEITPEETSKPDSSDKNTQQQLKARPKIVKKSPAGRSKTNNTKWAQQNTVNMEQSESRKDAENSRDVTLKSESFENVNKDAESSEKDNRKMDADSSEKDNRKTDAESPEKDNKMMDAEIVPEGTFKPGSSDKNTPQQLKARPKIVRKSPAGRSKTKKTKGDIGNMEQEESRKDAENSPDLSSKSGSSENVDSTKDVESSGKDNSMKDAESLGKDNRKTDADSLEKDNSKMDTESSEKDNKMKDAEVAPEGTGKRGSSDKNTPLQLKSRPKIVKKSLAVRSKTKRTKGTQRDTGNMEQEESRKDAENSPDVSFKSGSSENVSNKKDAESSEKDSMKDAENSPKGSSQLGSSDKKNPQSLKAKRKIMKKSLVGRFKIKTSTGVQGDIGNMGQEESRKDTENSLNMSPKSSLSEIDKSKKDTESSGKGNIKDAENAPSGSSQPESSDKISPQSLKGKSKIIRKSEVSGLKAKQTKCVQGDTRNREQEENRKDGEHPPNVSFKSESSEKDSSKKDAENPTVGSNKLDSSDKNTLQLQSLKVNPKIVKKSQVGKFKTNKNKGARKIWEKQKREIKKLWRKSDKKISLGTPQMRNTGEQPEKSQRDESNKVDTHNRSNGDKTLGRKNKGKRGDSTIGAMSKKSKGRDGGIRQSQSNEKNREKLGGLIFMCNAKTKPDCFHYGIMGVSAGKKDVVSGIKPGLKLFLYDFDLKLLYGIYQATSSGGMRLEPRAFEGLFPAQVRFSVNEDCYPLPESIFKRAIKENYNEKNKFKTELTVTQVRKLTELFRPVVIHSTLRPARSPPKAIIWDREVRDVGKESRPHSLRERAAREYYANSHLNSYNVLPDERDRRIERTEEASRNLFLTEREYRAYGIQRDRSVVNPPSHVNLRLDHYERDYERDHHAHLGPMYGDNAPVHAEILRPDPPYLNETRFQAYSRGSRHDYANDPYHHGTSSRGSHIQPLSREEIPSSSYFASERTLVGADEDLRRREADQDRRYSTNAAEAVSVYNRTQHYNGGGPDKAPIPVSSRYTFAGPSYSYR